jgi:signal-transduction protein with cAMP-binding, CBS, and nucleotidyltransferase domain
MEKVTIKAYAVKHKLSIFNVMKMLKSGKLKSTTVDENGKEQTYIILDDAIEEEVKNTIVPTDEKDTKGLNEEVRLLKNEVAKLREEIVQLSKKLG